MLNAEALHSSKFQTTKENTSTSGNYGENIEQICRRENSQMWTSQRLRRRSKSPALHDF
jgi:hypothetical protein